MPQRKSKEILWFAIPAFFSSMGVMTTDYFSRLAITFRADPGTTGKPSLALAGGPASD